MYIFVPNTLFHWTSASSILHQLVCIDSAFISIFHSKLLFPVYSYHLVSTLFYPNNNVTIIIFLSKVVGLSQLITITIMSRMRAKHSKYQTFLVNSVIRAYEKRWAMVTYRGNIVRRVFNEFAVYSETKIYDRLWEY